MAPTRVGFIGLSKTGWAPNAHLPELKANPDYEIVAICNSSVQSAQEAIKLYELPPSVKAYGNPEDLAKDKDIDLVVCSVRVDRHLPTISPSLKAGKDVLVEWPLGKNLAEAEELLRLKNEGGVKTAVVDLQARQAPIVKKLRDVIESGKIGKVLNSTWTAAGGGLGATITQAYEYLTQREVGGNLVTIHFGHSIDYIQAVLGYGFQTTKSVVANRRPIIKVLNNDDEKKVLEAEHKKTSDDTIFLTGILSNGIPLSYSLRGGKAFKGASALDWRIYGENGELRITGSGPFIQVGYPDLKIELHDFESDEVTEIKVDEDLEQFVFPARNVARVYKELRAGRNNCSFEDAVERHKLIAALYKENGIEN